MCKPCHSSTCVVRSASSIFSISKLLSGSTPARAGLDSPHCRRTSGYEGRHEIHRCIGSLLQIAATGPAIGSNCEGWNTSEYFEMATVADVMECVAAEPIRTREMRAARLLCMWRLRATIIRLSSPLWWTPEPIRNARNKSGKTPLHEAAASNDNPAVFATLMDTGADPNARDEVGWTPLHEAAARNGNLAVFTALMDAGADPNARIESGFTPLHAAASFNVNPAVIAALVDAGADPNARNENGSTPLHGAAWINVNPAVLAALLDAGADAKAQNSQGQTPWDLAKDRDVLEGTDAYWRLNDARF